MKRHILYIFVAMLAACVACTESDVPGGDPSAPQVGNVPLRLSVGNLVELQTRGTDAGLQNSTLAPGTRVGVFVMYERDYDSLRIGSAYHNATYSYDNVECRLGADGSLQPTQLTEIFYPMGRDTKIAVFAYAPYDKDMTREALLLPKDSIYVDMWQDADSIVLRNDLLLGTPALANPLRTPVADPEVSPSATEKLSLNMCHQRCRLVLDLKLSGTPGLLDGQPLFHADSILVYAENVPVAAPLGYSLDTAMVNYTVADRVVLDTMLIAVHTDVFVGEAQEMQLYATGIVLPCPSPIEPSFRIVMISGNERRYIRRKVAFPMALDRGTSVMFRTTVDARGEDILQ